MCPVGGPWVCGLKKQPINWCGFLEANCLCPPSKAQQKREIRKELRMRILWVLPHSAGPCSERGRWLGHTIGPTVRETGASASEERTRLNSTTSRFHWTVDFSYPHSNAPRTLRLRITTLIRGRGRFTAGRMGMEIAQAPFSPLAGGGGAELCQKCTRERLGIWPSNVSSAL